MRLTSNKKAGFTIIELLTVVSILGLLSSIILVRMEGITHKARLTKGMSFSNQIRSRIGGECLVDFEFDETSGTKANNNLNDFHGTLVNFNFTATSGWRPASECAVNSCLIFDGTNDYVNIAGDLGDPAGMTLDLWFKKANINAGAQYLMDGRNGGNWWFLQDYVSGNCTDANGNVCFNGLVEIKSTDMANGKWYNVVVTQDSSATKIYLNGDLKHVSTGTDPDLGNDVRIGTRYTNSSFFNGYIDNVRIYSKTITASAIKSNYLAGLKKLLASEKVTQEEAN